MEGSTLLDYAEFRLSSSRNRCELYVVAQGGAEKLASGLLKPFMAHLRVLHEQLDSGSPVIRLERPPPSRERRQWFTKGTLERFVRFVSTPEVLLRVKTLEDELSQLDQVRMFQESSLAVQQQQCEDQCLGGDVIISTSDDEGAGEVQDTRLMSRRLPYEMIDSKAEASKRELLKAMEVRLLAMQQEQNVAFSRASAAGFDGDNILDLIAFAEYFGAKRLREACIQFITLHKKKQQEKKRACAESRSTLTEAESSDSDMSLASNDGTDHESNSYDKKNNGREAGKFPMRSKKSTTDVPSREPGMSRERSISGSESSFSGRKVPLAVNKSRPTIGSNASSHEQVSSDAKRGSSENRQNRDVAPKEHNQESKESFKANAFPSQLHRVEAPQRQEEMASLGRDRQSLRTDAYPKEEATNSSHGVSPTQQGQTPSSVTLSNQSVSSSLNEPPSNEASSGGGAERSSGVVSVRRMSVQAAISMFENKQKSDASEAKKLGRQDSGGPVKSVLRRWSGAHELTSDSKSDAASGSQAEKDNNNDNVPTGPKKETIIDVAESNLMKDDNSNQHSSKPLAFSNQESHSASESDRIKRAAVLERKKCFERLLSNSGSGNQETEEEEKMDVSISKPTNYSQAEFKLENMKSPGSHTLRESIRAKQEEDKTLQGHGEQEARNQTSKRFFQVEQEKNMSFENYAVIKSNENSSGQEMNKSSGSKGTVSLKHPGSISSSSSLALGQSKLDSRNWQDSARNMPDSSAQVKVSSDLNDRLQEESNNTNTRNGDWQKQFKLKLERTLSREPVTTPESPLRTNSDRADYSTKQSKTDPGGMESRQRSLVKENLEKLTSKSFLQVSDDSGKTTAWQRIPQQDAETESSEIQPSIQKQGLLKGIPVPPKPPSKLIGNQIKVGSKQLDQDSLMILPGIVNSSSNFSGIKQAMHPNSKPYENSLKSYHSESESSALKNGRSSPSKVVPNLTESPHKLVGSPSRFYDAQIDANPSRFEALKTASSHGISSSNKTAYSQQVRITMPPLFNSNQDNAESEGPNSHSEMSAGQKKVTVKTKQTSGESTVSIDASSSRPRMKRNAMVNSLENSQRLFSGNNNEGLVTMLDNQKSVPMEDSYPEGVGRFYGQYAKLRDEKFRNEKPAKRAERQAKLRALEQTLDKRKTEMEAQSATSFRRKKSSLKSGLQLEKIRVPKPVLTRKEKEQEEYEEERLDLPENTQEWSDAYSGQSSPSSLPQSTNEQFSSFKSRGIKKSTSSKSSSHTASHQSKSTSRNQTAYMSQRRSGTSNLSNVADNPLARSVASFSELKKENTKLSSGRSLGSNNMHSKSFSGRSKNESAPAETNSSSSARSLTKRSLPTRKNCVTVAELKVLSSEGQGETNLPMSKAQDNGMPEMAFHGKASRNAVVSLPDGKTSHRKGGVVDRRSEINPAKFQPFAASDMPKYSDEDDGLSYSEMCNSDDRKKDGFRMLNQSTNVIVDGSEQVLRSEDEDSLNLAAIHPVYDDRIGEKEADRRVLEASRDNFESSEGSIHRNSHHPISASGIQDMLPEVSQYDHTVLSKLDVPDSGQEDTCLSVASSFRASSLPHDHISAPYSPTGASPSSSMLQPETFSYFPSPSVATLDSPLGSPSSWNSSQTAFTSEVDLVRGRKKWGQSQKNVSLPSQTVKEPAKGFKRFLKFGRKSRPSETTTTDWVSASTTSEGDDDVEEVKEYGSQSTDDLLRRVRTHGGAVDLDLFGSGDPLGIQQQGTIPSIRTSIPVPPPNFKLREDHIPGGTSLKGPRSFFSLSTFRSKGNERKELVKP